MTILGIGEVADLASNIVNKIWPDKSQQEKDALAFQMQKEVLASDLVKGQLAINQAEAASKSIFVAGWRPWIGWICGSAFAWSYVLAPFLNYFAALFGHPVTLPALNLDGMMPVLLGMLGLGTMRTTEKLKGIDAGH